MRRTKISERIKKLQDLVPNLDKVIAEQLIMELVVSSKIRWIYILLFLFVDEASEHGGYAGWGCGVCEAAPMEDPGTSIIHFR